MNERLLLFLTFFLAGKTANYDLLLCGAVGLFLCAQYRQRGFAYALLLLGVSCIGKHLWLDGHHLWQLGLEGSVALGFLTLTLLTQEEDEVKRGQELQKELKDKTIAHLEEELILERRARADEQLQARENLSLERETLEEVQKELFSFQMLNDVLRTAAAKLAEEKEALSTKLLQEERFSAQLVQERDALEQELQRLSNEDSLAIQNKTLFQELNAARAKEAQTHLINETLVRLHAKVAAEKEALRVELESVVKQPVVEQLPPSYFEHLYRQLKVQFDEKNEILHQTRAQLFKADNELQTLQRALDNEALEQDPLPPNLRSEIEQLVEEHQLLEELVTHLMHSAAEPPLKKLKKKADEISTQETLF